MAATAGKAALVKLGANTIANIKSATIEIDGVNLDVTALGAANGFMSRIQGLLDAKITLSGSYDTSDTNGQVALRTAFLAGTTISISVLPNGTNGFSTNAFVTKYSIGADVSKEVTLQIDLEGSGGITVI